MSLLSPQKNKKRKKTADNSDSVVISPEELEELLKQSQEQAREAEKKAEEYTAEAAPKGFKKYKKGRRAYVRIEELEKRLAESGAEIDEDEVISMFIPRRRIRNLAAALLRLDRLRLTLLMLVLVVAGLFIMSFMQEKMGNFTINLDRLELYRRGITISADSVFTEPTARLAASTVQDATNISIEDLPKNIDEVDGDHNGRNYMAYTYYVRNAGKEPVDYIAAVLLESCSKGAEDAVRVAVWRNGERVVYAEPSASGEPEQDCVNFESEDIVCSYTAENFEVGYVDKYTIVIWMEGDDPECLDNIIGGSVEFSMNISATETNKTSLFVMFVQDIIESLTTDDSISAAGTNAPDYYLRQNITYENRLNK